ncbi:hypothetical protein FB451DRAFT_1164078 [Mycena latifolia]|nr:hypothetical protein FB451DRAFT_1164078 [Mycena latifolia]
MAHLSEEEYLRDVISARGSAGGRVWYSPNQVRHVLQSANYDQVFDGRGEQYQDVLSRPVHDDNEQQIPNRVQHDKSSIIAVDPKAHAHTEAGTKRKIPEASGYSAEAKNEHVRKYMRPTEINYAPSDPPRQTPTGVSSHMPQTHVPRPPTSQASINHQVPPQPQNSKHPHKSERRNGNYAPPLHPRTPHTSVSATRPRTGIQLPFSFDPEAPLNQYPGSPQINQPTARLSMHPSPTPARNPHRGPLPP